MSKAVNNIKEFAIIAFTLLGVLFGMMIMTFIFGQLGPSASGLTSGTTAYNVSANVQNNSLQAINTYSSGAKTQFSTLSIAIVLVVLIAVFLLFWKIFVANGKSRSRKSGGSDLFQ